MINTYFIGGSPCGGKSTAAAVIAQKYNLYYFKVDDFLDKYMQMAVSNGSEICSKLEKMTADQIWMRDPHLQCQEEFIYYEEIFPFILDDLKQINHVKGIITEGTAYTPQLMKRISVPHNRYLSVTPTPEFQISHFRKREFVPYVLHDCTDKQAAFNKWMDRDILFAKEVQKQCDLEGYVSFVNSGQKSVTEMVDMISEHFKL